MVEQHVNLLVVNIDFWVKNHCQDVCSVWFQSKTMNDLLTDTMLKFYMDSLLI